MAISPYPFVPTNPRRLLRHCVPRKDTLGALPLHVIASPPLADVAISPCLSSNEFVGATRWVAPFTLKLGGWGLCHSELWRRISVLSLTLLPIRDSSVVRLRRAPTRVGAHNYMPSPSRFGSMRSAGQIHPPRPWVCYLGFSFADKLKPKVAHRCSGSQSSRALESSSKFCQSLGEINLVPVTVPKITHGGVP